ncbi:MAG: RNA methyltransferase [Bacteroidaceae bacterium]|nr:RNA methyltransferase [Bacteroidaceae bacterium]
MLSKNLIKLIRSLEMKKFRKESGLFVAEGEKIVFDLIAAGMECVKLIATKRFLASLPALEGTEIIETDDDELKKASFLRTPQGIMALFRQRDEACDFSVASRELSLALDDVQDPGNLGTIIRIADWFGIENVFCSQGTVDVYNPKTVQATMGALARVNVHYVDLPKFLSAAREAGAPVYGTFLNGGNIYEHGLSAAGVIVMGNEGKGIGAECERLVSDRILIPNFPAGRATSESLNVSTATAIVCSEFRRRNF